MGDRCWVEVTVRKEHEQKFLEVVGYDWDERSEDTHTVTLHFAEANYGMGQPLDQASAVGIEFYGHHGNGDSYGASDFFSPKDINEGVAYICTGHDGGGVLIDGSTPQRRLARLQELEARIAQREDLIQRMHNPLYDIVRTADAAAS